MSTTTKSNQLTPFIGIAFFALVAAVIFEPVGTYQQAFSYLYEVVDGRVVKVVPEAEDRPAKIDYSYVVDGQRYFSERFSWIKADTHFQFDEVVGSLQAGDRVTVYVHADHRDHSVLIRGLSRTAWFTLAWSSGPVVGFLIMWSRFRSARRPQDECDRDFRDRVETLGSKQRLRIVPGGFTPWSAGLICFAAMAVIVLLVLMAGNRVTWWNVSIATALAISLACGLASGVFDYYYTLRGNERGRWDLIVDRENGTLQVPAIGAYGEPFTVSTDDVTGFSIDPLVPFDSDENDYMPALVLKLHQRDDATDRGLKVSVSRSEAELAALAEWIWEAAGLPRA